MDAGDLVRRARARAGFSQRDLAREADTSQSALWAIESGRRSPTVQTLDRLLAACGLQQRVSLEALLAELDARVDALQGEVPELDADSWRWFADVLDDLPQTMAFLATAPRRGAVTWAIDGSAAMALHGFAVELSDFEVVVELNEPLRFWMKAVLLRGTDERENLVMDWFDADLGRMQSSLPGARYCLLGLARVRVVAALPATMTLQVGWLDRLRQRRSLRA